jgi:[lysine-biosynthesis-protein LysW]---L-2-aminoadipate ligase
VPASQRPLVLVASRIRWEEKQILEALERARAPFVTLDPRTMRVSLDDPPPWPLALDREIAYTRALYAALALEAHGVRLVNTAAAIAVCGDKWRTAVALREAGLPTPRRLLALTPDAARLAAEELGYPVVIKPTNGSWGRRVALVRDPDAADGVLDYCAALPAPQARVLCVEEPIEKPGRDIRVLVVGDEPLGAVDRVADGWRTNVAIGAEARPRRLDDALAALALGAARATGAEVAGVDVLEGPDGEPYVLEVNGVVEFRGFAGALDVDVAGAIVGHALGTLDDDDLDPSLAVELGA